MKVSHTGYWLAGTIFAEGLGENGVADIWTQQIVSVLGEGWDRATELCAIAFAGSSQVERRRSLAATFKDDTAKVSWIGRMRLERFTDESNLKIKLPAADKQSNTTVMTDLLSGYH